jgi:hypothetical protein
VRRVFASSSAALFLGFVLACGGSTEQEVTGPGEVVRCPPRLVLPPPLPAAATRTEAPLSIARDCTWSARTAAPWLAVSPITGQGDATLTLTANENPQGRVRSATIDINEQPFTIMQEAQPCRFEVAPTSISVPHQGGRTTIRVTTLEGCSWTTRASDPWLRVISGTGGDTSGSIELAIDSNGGPERSAVLTLATAQMVVNQAAGPDDRTECGYSIGPGAHVIPAEGGTASFRVSTMSACAWGASSNQPWITVVSGNGVGTGEVHYRVDRNTSTSNRSGTITAGTRRHVVQQQAAPRQ